MIPLVELHCHIEGAALPELVVKQADKYQTDTSSFLKNGAYIWHDFTTFLAAYDGAAALFRDEEDYAALSETYLDSIARQGAIYSEIIISTDHATKAGLTPKAYIDGLTEGIRRANNKHGIECRMIASGVRHFGVDAVINAAQYAADNPHPLITGFNMAGDERIGAPQDYARAFDIARDAGLGLTIHAGELCGWESVENALDATSPSRIGHGVRAIENPDLVKRLAEEEILLEICPGSNMALKIFDSFAAHPFNQLQQAGVKVCLNADDPPFFHTSLDQEYQSARTHFGLNDEELRQTSRLALQYAFVDEPTRQKLLAKL